ncbi:hypothetical protein SS50377_27753 [Spironucleus salmonicida]|uniref:F-box/LRR-repeat protein 15/At3g58940/PEG3-like LRR domain-containing protein n=1 Tax=Spironucleus salmonicida TaxID=348837 RepID=V6LWE1_9EUKA|nr:hypothetical protein SS50377_27753 [Spironucleus salmonicida]|eukprot:EST48885.1 Hypothetical protein SS50377_10993 [Spironucleus salmonicida]
MTDGARAADRSGDAAPESQSLMTTTIPAAAELPDPPVAHLSLDGRWDAAVRLDALTSLALADMDGTEPLRYVGNVRDLRLERVSGKMDVGPALARLTIVDSPIMCRNPQGRDLPNLTEVIISCTSKEFSEPCELASNWQPLLNILQGAKQLKNMTLNRSGTPYASAPDMSGLRQLEMLALNGITGSVYFPPSLRSVTLTDCIDSIFQCDADSLPDLRYICLDLIKYDQLSLDIILERTHALQSLTLKYSGSLYDAYKMCPPQISRLKQLETLALDGIEGDICFSPSLRSITLTKCTVNNFQCSVKSLPDLREIFLDDVYCDQPSLNKILGKADRLRSLKMKYNESVVPSNKVHSLYTSRLKQLETLALDGIEGDICFPPSLRSITLTKCTVNNFQCSVKSLPDLREIFLDDVYCDQPSLNKILGRANGLRKLTLKYNRYFQSIYKVWPVQISRLTQLETLVLDGIEGDICFSPSLQSITLTKCTVNNFQCDADSLPELREIVLEGVTNESTSLARVMQLAHGLERFIVRGTAENCTAVLELYLQPSVMMLELDRVRLERLVLVGAPCVERLRLRNICIPPDQLPVLARLVRVRTVMYLKVSCIGVGSGQQDAASLQQFALPAFIRRHGVDIELAVRVGQQYVQRGSMVYQEGDSQPVALPTRLAAFVYRQKIEPLVVLCGALVE